MKKLALRLDDLTVDSFEPAPAPSGRGTVHGAGADSIGLCTFGPDVTCENSCGGGETCDPTCHGYITFVGWHCQFC